MAGATGPSSAAAEGLGGRSQFLLQPIREGSVLAVDDWQAHSFPAIGGVSLPYLQLLLPPRLLFYVRVDGAF